MIERNGQKLYTVKEVVKILGVNYARVKNAYIRRQIIPTDIEKCGGRNGFMYLYNEQAINDYAGKIGLTPIFENYVYAYKKTDDEKRRELQAMKEISFMLEGSKKDNGVLITEENVKDVFAQIQKHEEPKEQTVEINAFAVKLGKGFISNENNRLFTSMNGSCLYKKRDIAERLANDFGGQLLQIYGRVLNVDEQSANAG